MRFHHLDLNLLVALDALLAEQNVARAAERLHLSPSAASGALARLRDYFEDELLVQVGRKLQPTPRALALQAAVRDVLLRVDANIARQPPFDATTSHRTFRVIASDYAQFIFIPHLLAVCAEQRGSVGFEFIAPAGDPVKQLERGEVDAVVLPQGHLEADLPRLVLHEDRFVAVVRQDGVLAEAPLTLDRYLAARHVVLQTAPGSGLSSLEKWFAAQGRQRPVHIRTSEVATLMALLAHGDSVATVHERLAQRLSAAWPVVLRPVPMALPPLVQTLQWHPYAERDPGVAWLRECARQAAGRMAALPDPHRDEASVPST